jgi:hypothetical protein
MDRDQLMQLIGNHNDLVKEKNSYEHSHNEGIPWYEIKPFSELNDPLYGISAHERWKLVEPIFKSVQQEVSLAIHNDGAEFDEWKRKYCDGWYKEVEKTKWFETFKAQQMKAVYAYSGQEIAVKKGFTFSNGRKLKRGERGNILGLEALEIFDEVKVRGFLLRIRETGSSLVHIKGYIMMLPEEYFRFVKK